MEYTFSNWWLTRQERSRRNISSHQSSRRLEMPLMGLVQSPMGSLLSILVPLLDWTLAWYMLVVFSPCLVIPLLLANSSLCPIDPCMAESARMPGGWRRGRGWRVCLFWRRPFLSNREDDTTLLATRAIFESGKASSASPNCGLFTTVLLLPIVALTPRSRRRLL